MCLSGFKARRRTVSKMTLASPVSMNRSGVEAGRREVSGEEIRVSLLADEDENSLSRDRAKNFQELLSLVELLHLDDRLIHVRIGAAHNANGQENVFLWRRGLHECQRNMCDRM